MPIVIPINLATKIRWQIPYIPNISIIMPSTSASIQDFDVEAFFIANDSAIDETPSNIIQIAKIISIIKSSTA